VLSSGTPTPIPHGVKSTNKTQQKKIKTDTFIKFNIKKKKKKTIFLIFDLHYAISKLSVSSIVIKSLSAAKEKHFNKRIVLSEEKKTLKSFCNKRSIKLMDWPL
jgi:hypothetical protein